MVVLFQGGIFSLLWRHISWDTSQNQCSSSANGCYVHRACKRAGICFQCTSGAFSPTVTLSGLSFCRSWKRGLHNLKSVWQIWVYSIDTAGAYLWLNHGRALFWLCQHNRPQLINKHQELKLRDETAMMARLKLSSLFSPTHLNANKSPGKHHFRVRTWCLFQTLKLPAPQGTHPFIR